MTGIGVNRWARRDLGASYHPLVVAEAGRPLARSGPYRLVRHPMYLGSVAVCAGCALLAGAPLPAAVWLLGPPSALVHRIRVEERALAAAHGDGYRSGGAAHRLVPGVW